MRFNSNKLNIVITFFEGKYSILEIDYFSVDTLEELNSITPVVSLNPDQLNFKNHSSATELLVRDFIDFSIALKIMIW